MSNPNKIAKEMPGTAASPLYSPIVISENQVYLAGQVGSDASGNIVSGTVQDRTRAALERTGERLAEVGLDLSDIVSVQIFLSKYTEDFAPMNEAYIAAFAGKGPLPVRTCVGVAALPKGTDIELTIIAAKRS